jgi:hypothetical protein
MEQTECSETSAHKIQTPGNYPEENIQQSENWIPVGGQIFHTHPDWPWGPPSLPIQWVDCIWNVMAHVQKPDFPFRRNGRVHLNRHGRQFSGLLAAEMYAPAVVMLDTPCSEVVWRVLPTHSICQLPFISPPVHRHVPSHFNWTLTRLFPMVKTARAWCWPPTHHHLVSRRSKIWSIPLLCLPLGFHGLFFAFTLYTTRYQ